RRLGQRAVDVRLERNDRAAPPAAVGGHHHAGLRVVHTIAQGLRREAAEDQAVSGADAGAGEHDDRRFGDHREIDPHAVTLANAEPAQHVREPTHLAMQALVGEHPRLTLRLADPDQCRLVAAWAAQMAIEAVVGHVQRAADEPLRERRLPVEHALPWSAPAQPVRMLRPESLGIVERTAVQRVVRRTTAHAGRIRESARWVEDAVLAQHRFDGGLASWVGHGAPQGSWRRPGRASKASAGPRSPGPVETLTSPCNGYR